VDIAPPVVPHSMPSWASNRYEEKAMKTAITEMLGIEHPIIQGGMHYVGYADLASAVSNAGGLGIITGLTQPTAEDLANEIARCRDMMDKPFGVNLTFLPGLKPPDYPAYAKTIVEGGVRVVETAGRNPQIVMPILKDAGVKIIHKCTSVRHALKAQSIGCDAASIDGFECGGHPGEDDIPNMILLPRAADELEIPFVSSGGMAMRDRSSPRRRSSATPLSSRTSSKRWRASTRASCRKATWTRAPGRAAWSRVSSTTSRPAKS
jgi:NAD(P)H-dependent flavin oxidoreductase YrpB (nitropropane dioxygenase family)